MCFWQGFAKDWFNPSLAELGGLFCTGSRRHWDYSGNRGVAPSSDEKNDLERAETEAYKSRRVMARGFSSPENDHTSSLRALMSPDADG